MPYKHSLSKDEIRYITRKNENWYKFIDAIEDYELNIDEAVDLLISEGVSSEEISEILKKYEKWF